MGLFECSYAGVGLSVPTEEGRAEVERLISTLDLRDVQPLPRWPGKNLAGIAWNDPIKEPPFRLGQLFWPCGASRWAVGRFLATHHQVRQILGEVQPSGGSPPEPKPLVLQADRGVVTGKITAAKMYMLPPRPLTGLLTDPILPFVGTPTVTGPTDLYLLTLVDQRYFWQYAAAGESLFAEGEDWDFYSSEIGSVTLSGTTFYQTVPTEAVYGYPEQDSPFYASLENAAVLLDAVLANTGRVLKADYDGSYTIQKITEALSSAKTERSRWVDVRTAGGRVLILDSSVPATDHLRDLILPEKVTVTFPQWVDGKGYYERSPNNRGWIKNSYGGVKAYSVNTTSLTGFSAAKPMTGWEKVFHDTAKARYPDRATLEGGVTPPTTDAALLALATQVAHDYCDSLKARLDEVYPGIIDWTPDGVNDLTFLYTVERAWTRVQGPPLNGGVTELQHSLGPLEVPATTATDVQLVRIETWFCRDGVSATGCAGSPSPRCYYPGVIQKWNCTSGHVDDTDKEKVWVDLTATQAPYPGSGGAPDTTVPADGNYRLFAKATGQRYAPDEGTVVPPHPNNGEDRPVYVSDNYGAVWAVTCDGVPTGVLAGSG